MLYQTILSNFQKELTTIQKRDDDVLLQCNSGKFLSVRTLGLMREMVEMKDFKSLTDEIHFFKNIKSIPMSFLVNYAKIFKLELGMPKLGFVSQKKYLQGQIYKINKRFKKESNLLEYLESNFTHCDEQYFTRNNIYNTSLSEINFPYYKDYLFNTSHDILWAELKGLKMFAEYLERRYMSFQNSKSTKKASNNMKWTGSSAAFVEFVYGCHAMGYFNNGNITVSMVFNELGHYLNIPVNNPSRTYYEIKNRKSSRIKFFKEAGDKLLEKMDSEDGFDG